jgi:type VI secretion system secreted protein Hcp
MAIDCHIKFEGVEGEAVHKDHKGEVEVLSWSWGAHNAANPRAGGMGTGKGEPSAFNFMHSYDKSSPVLAKHCASGKHFKDVTLTARKSGEGQKDFFKVVMKEVFITSVQPQANQSGGIMETVAMSYKDIEFFYKPQDAKGGLGGEVKFGWNTKSTKIT